jgi:hypothetical protein
MKASELIKALEESIKIHGDIQVLYEEDGFGGHADHVITGIREGYTDTYISEEVCCDEEEIEEMYQKLGISPEDGTFKAFVLKGTLVSST